MSNKKDTCSNCIYWARAYNLDNPEDKYDYGQCRKNPPFADMQIKYIDAKNIKGLWPLTNEDDWCGEHYKPLRSKIKPLDLNNLSDTLTKLPEK